MTKKRIDSAESTESSEDESQSSNKGCPHINKGIVINTLRKQFQGSNFKIVPPASSYRSRAISSPAVKTQASDVKGCKECRMSGTTTKEEDLWICLRCGVIACGSPSNNDSHITKHFTLPRSDPHIAAVNVEKWTSWCYKCNSDVDSNCTKNLQQATEFLKKHFKPETLAEEPKVNGSSALTNGDDTKTSAERKSTIAKPLAEHNRVKGLVNLGNTCFFNSVVQCLSQTPGLLTLLSESEEGEKFSLAGCPSEEDRPALPPLEGTLEPPGFVTKELARTLEQMQEGSHAATVNPKSLLNALNQKAPHLAGTGDQEDSHELLRTLMESVRSEELRRYQGQILDAIGVSRKNDPTTVDEDKKYMGKVYSNLASKLYLRPDHLFQGQLISILQCQECLTTSCVPETFLDISLPVVNQRQTPPLARNMSKNSADSASDVPSKHQLKKARKASRKGKGKKSKSTQEKANNENDDADVEDSESQGKSVETDSVDNSKDDQRDDSDDAANGDEEDETGDEKEDEGKENAKGSTEKLVNGEANGEKSSSEEKCAEKLENLKLSDDENGASALAEPEDPDKVKKFADDEVEDNAVGENDNSRWSSTIVPRFTVSDPSGETSLNSCLNQFVAIELLTGNNKVGCETCTKRAGKSADGKTVCTNFTKQLLISAPPAILTLHLKRFEVCGSRFRKVSKAVNFPLILDLASICSVKCLELPTVRRNQTKLLYSLYGVVVHHGMLSGGHYVAYVKSQKPPSPEDFRKKFMLSNNPKQSLNAEECDNDVMPEPPPGQWYYASDSFVSEVSEKKVLEQQAYLLFYERIY